jgi:hypothetical protein
MRKKVLKKGYILLLNENDKVLKYNEIRRV